MEFLRFGSSIPGSYWGCCAVDIIQDFKHDPDAKASIQLVSGDGGGPIVNEKGAIFAGMTYKDIFLQRLRYGTFGKSDMPNHAFLAVLTESQISGGGYGAKWLKILKETGFEFIRTVDNSVYTGYAVDDLKKPSNMSSHPNHLFGLFRNVGRGAIKNPFVPPKAWTKLPSVVYEAWQDMEKMGDLSELTQKVREQQLELFNALPKGVFYSEAELVAAGVPVTLAGIRSKFPQELKSSRDKKIENEQKLGKKDVTSSFPCPEPAEDYDDMEYEYDAVE